MTRQTAMRVRMELAMAVDPKSVASIGDVAAQIEALKKSAEDLGFTFTADVWAKLGTIAADVGAVPE